MFREMGIKVIQTRRISEKEDLAEEIMVYVLRDGTMYFD